MKKKFKIKYKNYKKVNIKEKKTTKIKKQKKCILS